VRDGEGWYVLERTARELDRLDLQGVLYREVTWRALVEGGIEAGMRVLDAGCGSGDVSFLAGEVVGRGGTVVGVDREAGAVEAAGERARRRGVTNVTFRNARFADVLEYAGFDALVGRFVLMHQSDPSAVLSAALHNIRPGGAVVFVESSMASILSHHSLPHSPAYDAVVRWMCAVVGGSGADLEAGLRLRRTFLGAGLREPVLHLEARVEGGSDSAMYAYVAESVRSLLPRARALGIEGFDETTVGTLAERLREEVVRSDGVLVNWPVVAGWARRPA